MKKIILDQRVVIPLPAPTNLVTRIVSVDEEGQGLYFEPHTTREDLSATTTKYDTN